MRVPRHHHRLGSHLPSATPLGIPPPSPSSAAGPSNPNTHPFRSWRALDLHRSHANSPSRAPSSHSHSRSQSSPPTSTTTTTTTTRRTPPFSPQRATSSARLISSPSDLSTYLAELPRSVSLYVDLEGHWLSRHGSLDILTLLSYPQGIVRLIDVCTLQHAAFSTPAADNPHLTLRSILEDPSVPKYLWDVRNDADALWSHYGVTIKGTTDLQLLENASRHKGREFLRPLTHSIQTDLHLSSAELALWMATKNKVRGLMDRRLQASTARSDTTHPSPSRQPVVALGGNLLTRKIPQVLLDAAASATAAASARTANPSRSPTQTTGPSRRPISRPPPPESMNLSDSIFRARPLPSEVFAYCANDVVHLPGLHARFMAKLSPDSPWHDRIQIASARRVKEAQARDYEPHGVSKHFSPWHDASLIRAE